MSETEKQMNAAPEEKTMRMKLIRALKHLFFHNGLLKAIAIVISVILWAGLVSQDESITRDKVFQNVNVTVTGTEAMRNNGYIVVSDLNELLKDVSVTAAVPQKQFENAEASAYNVRMDLSRINGTGEQELKLLSSNSSTYGKVVSTNPSSVTVMVEDFVVRQRIPVSVTVNGDVPDGWYMSTPSVDPALVAVSGPRSLVTTISRARAFIDTRDIEYPLYELDGAVLELVGLTVEGFIRRKDLRRGNGTRRDVLRIKRHGVFIQVPLQTRQEGLT